MPPELILASASPGRRELLARLRLPFEILPANVDETPQAAESPARLVARLARAKAQSVFAQHPQAVVIGSDQVADLDGVILGKPGSREAAAEQLRRQSGRRVVFRTGLCVLAPTTPPQEAVVDVQTTYRRLSDAEIERYIGAEDIVATAGSMQSEGLGITLVEAIRSDDPTALIGLPLITLRRMLARAGLAVP